MEKKRLESPVREAYLLCKRGEEELYIPMPRITKDEKCFYAEEITAGTFFAGEYTPKLKLAGSLRCTQNLDTTLSKEEFGELEKLIALYELARKSSWMTDNQKKDILKLSSDQLRVLLAPCEEENEHERIVRLNYENYYFLGTDKNNKSYYLEEDSDLSSLKVWILKKNKHLDLYSYSTKYVGTLSKELLEKLKMPFTEDEKFLIKSLLKDISIIEGYAKMLKLAELPWALPSQKVACTIKNGDELLRIFEKVLPTLVEELYLILKKEA